MATEEIVERASSAVVAANIPAMAVGHDAAARMTDTPWHKGDAFRSPLAFTRPRRTRADERGAPTTKTTKLRAIPSNGIAVVAIAAPGTSLRCIVHPPKCERVDRHPLHTTDPSSVPFLLPPTTPAACNKDRLHDNAPAVAERATVDSETLSRQPSRHRPFLSFLFLPFRTVAILYTICILNIHCSLRIWFRWQMLTRNDVLTRQGKPSLVDFFVNLEKTRFATFMLISLFVPFRTNVKLAPEDFAKVQN